MAESVLPVVTLMFPCADAKVDAAKTQTVITDPIHAVFYPAGTEFPQTSGRLFLYVHLKESVGPFDYRIEVRGEEGKLLRRTKPRRLQIDVDTRFLGEELVFEVPAFEIPGPGVLRIDFYANHVCLKSCEVRVLTAGRSL